MHPGEDPPTFYCYMSNVILPNREPNFFHREAKTARSPNISTRNYKQYNALFKTIDTYERVFER